ncbi:hypothetical protein V3O24_01430 [Methylobacter sp. Wu8]|uniref:hypothetical protein n=1 Tax=Methylobacter sp. Wu8 TaxID=3118457 RepID=UPI002F2E4295
MNNNFFQLDSVSILSAQEVSAYRLLITSQAKNSSSIFPAGCTADLFRLCQTCPEISQVSSMTTQATPVTAVEAGAAMAAIIATHRQIKRDFSAIAV